MKASEINLTEKQKKILTEFSRGTHQLLHLKKRSKIILQAAAGSSNNAIERDMGLDKNQVKRWRDRYAAKREELLFIEKERPHKLRSAIIEALSDLQRSGGPAKFRDDQVAAIIAVACESPEKFDLPLSHWTTSQLQRKVIELAIVESISVRQVGRILEKKHLRPHLSKGWLNPDIKNFEKFQKSVSEISAIYNAIKFLTGKNVHVYSTDEKMGIPAREHVNPKQNMKPGQIERIDPEYIRHGVSGIIASRNVATGEIVEPLIQPERKEPDYLRHIKKVVSLNPNDKHIFLNDGLNTHFSESLVRFVAEVEGIDESTLGVKGKYGILKNMESRREFLTDNKHQIVFVYTPKHCSWLNQIECWFSIITRHILNKRASFTSVEHLETKIKEYIDFYNKFLKKPFAWNYVGKLLTV